MAAAGGWWKGGSGCRSAARAGRVRATADSRRAQWLNGPLMSMRGWGGEPVKYFILTND